VVLSSTVVDTAVAAASGPSATSSTRITMEPSPLCTGARRSKAGAIGQPREYAAPAGKPLQTGLAARGRAPLAFAVRTGKMLAATRARGGGRCVEPHHLHSRPLPPHPRTTADS